MASSGREGGASSSSPKINSEIVSIPPPLGMLCTTFPGCLGTTFFILIHFIKYILNKYIF